MEAYQEMHLRDNDRVNELCGCRASELTLSRRILQDHHEDWCFYYMFIEERRQNLLKRSAPESKRR